LLGLVGVVRREIADVNVERDAMSLGPGVHGQVRLRQQGSAGHAARLALPIRERVELFVDERQPGVADGAPTQARENLRVDQQGCLALASVQVCGQMHTLHVSTNPVLVSMPAAVNRSAGPMERWWDPDEAPLRRGG